MHNLYEYTRINNVVKKESGISVTRDYPWTGFPLRFLPPRSLSRRAADQSPLLSPPSPETVVE